MRLLLMLLLLAMPTQAASLDTPDASGRTPLLQAVQAGDLTEAKRLIAAGADINAQAANKDTPWLLAGALGHTEMLAAMLETGRVDYALRNRYGGDALIPACERGHVETVKFLLEKSEIDVNHINDLGWTCLLEAVILGNDGAAYQEIVRLALAVGADPNLPDRDGITPLGNAKEHGRKEIARLIEQAGGQ